MKMIFNFLFVAFCITSWAQSKYNIKDNQLILPEAIVFDLHANDVFDTTDAMLNYVANYLKENPKVTKLRVESHVFTEKDTTENIKLSLQRAAMICYYLTTKGVICNRLIATGFGNTKPLLNAITEDEHTRIDFFIEELQNKPIPNPKTLDCKFYNPCDD